MGDDKDFRFTQIETVIMRIESKMDKMTEALQTLARLDERDSATQQRLIDGAKTMSEMQQRLAAIEQHMPGLKEMRALITRAVIGCMSAVGLAVLALVLHK